MDMITLTLTGRSPLLMHSAQFADPLDAGARNHSALVKVAKKSKTPEAILAVAKSEYVGGMYYDRELGPYVPGTMIRAALVDGARLSREGKDVVRAVQIIDDRLALEYEGPRDPDALWENPAFRDGRTVVVSNRRLMRYRPMFKQWELQVRVFFDPSMVEPAKLLMFADKAGQYVGIGDFRPDKGGSFGRFKVTAGPVICDVTGDDDAE